MANTVTQSQIDHLFEEVNDDLIDVRNTAIWKKWEKLPRAELTHRQRTIVGLLSDRNDFDACDLGTRIFYCTLSKPCGSVLCPRCRSVAQKSMSRLLQRHFGNVERSQLRFLTVLCKLSYSPRFELPEERRNLKRQLDTSLRMLSPTPRVYGAYELDVKHRDFARSKRSKTVLTALDEHFLSNRSHSYLLHLHAVVDLNGCDDDTVKRRLKDRFDGPYRVRCTNLWSSRSVHENLDVLGHYMTKSRLQYSDNLYGNSTKGTARYMRFYPDHVIREVTHTLKRLHGNRHYAKYSWNV